MVKILFIVMLGVGCLVSLSIGYGVIPWQKKGTEPTEAQDIKMKKYSKISGFGLAILFTIYLLEEVGLW